MFIFLLILFILNKLSLKFLIDSFLPQGHNQDLHGCGGKIASQFSMMVAFGGMKGKVRESRAGEACLPIRQFPWNPVRIKADYGEESLGKGQESLPLFPRASCAVTTAGELVPDHT